MYSLPPSLKPCEAVDTTNTRYLNQFNDPLTNPLKKSLYTELCNGKWFNKPLPTSIPPLTYQHDNLKIPTAFLSYFSSVIELYKEATVRESRYQFFKSSLSLTLHKLPTTTGCLFFIQYLVQGNHHETEILKMNSLLTGDYHVTFLSRHPTDNGSLWWFDWHEYYLDESNIPVYDARMLFSPRRKPDLTKYILWTDSVHLTDTSCFLHGPFNFDS